MDLPSGATVADLQGVLPAAAVAELYGYLAKATGSAGIAAQQLEPAHRDSIPLVEWFATVLASYANLQTFLAQLPTLAPQVRWAELEREAAQIAGVMRANQTPDWPPKLPGVPPIPEAFR